MQRRNVSRWGAVLVAVMASCASGDEVRPPAVAGAFYERLPIALQAQVDGLLESAVHSGATGRLVAAVAPHAGYVYSGHCAAGVYRLLTSGEVSRVVILAPSHHVAFVGLSLPAEGVRAYRTPLGDVPLDMALCGALRTKPGFSSVAGADVREHAVEVHLPFLQRRLGAFSLVPLICGQLDASTVAAAAEALSPYAGTGTLFIASSDFTHYGPNYDFLPFTTRVEGALKEWLGDATRAIAAVDAGAFDRHCRATHDTICGQNPIRVLLATLTRSGLSLRGQVLDTGTSGDVVGNYENSVSYAAIGFFSGNKADTPSGGTMTNTPGKETSAFRLTEASQKRLLEIARQSIQNYLKSREIPAFDVAPGELTAPAAVFVTLTQRGQLRGCIGTTEPRDALWQAVARLAVAAAVEDGRFEPLTPDELPRTHIEISVLSPMQRVKSADAIREKEHGVVVRRGWRSGLFLPQVWEHFATKEGFLDELCRQKAHLEAQAWRDPATELYVFTVFAFEEPAR